MSVSYYVLHRVDSRRFESGFWIAAPSPRFLEFIGAPESASLLYHSPTFWVQRLGEEDELAAAVNLQRDAGLMSSNLQIRSQFVTSLNVL